MRRWLLALVFIVTFCLPGAAQEPEPGKPIRLERWRVGKLGIKTETPGGVLRVSNGAGWISTHAEYVDFTLRVRFRAMTDDAEGAILFRAWQRLPGEWPKTGYRLGISGPAGKRQDRLVTAFSPNSALQAVAPVEQVAPPPLGEWRQLEIHCQNDRITVRIEGQELAVLEGTEPQAGAIGIEARKGVIEYDDIWLTLDPLPSMWASRAASSTTATSEPAVRATEPGLKLPRLLRRVEPRYSIAAQAAGVEGLVVLEATVMPDGGATDIKVRRSLDWNLDAESIAALRRWRFEPALRGSTPVPCIVTIEMTFILAAGPAR